MDIGKKLKELRIEKGITQAQIAQVLKVSRIVYNRYENNTRTISLELLSELADFYHVTLDYLCGRED